MSFVTADCALMTGKPYLIHQVRVADNHELGYQFRTNFSTIHPIREDQEEKRAQL
jgi:hypothetical protein